ncbi:hypothetical protein LWI28_000072 [Acer negundo]|uniref:Legume lectin domain-containing protein n=1 Tax=Acer negundo TaxID=4023 RepID=A0AAD5I4J2_ACENE|nr:hypothetical protein LWI28_000072 [Acer negundo]
MTLELEMTHEEALEGKQSLPITNKSGRAFYNRRFRLWKKRGVNAVFNSSFTLHIKNQTSTAGEGLAFVLTDSTGVPVNSDGQWLGIVNATTNGISQANIVAIEFDTRKSYPQDLDGNHVGLDINSICSIKQVSLNSYGVNLSTGTIVTVHVQYDGKNITVSVGHNAENLDLVLSYPIDLSEFLPQKVFVGFTASTGIYTQINCVKSWEFNGSDFDEGLKFWVWIVVAAAVVVLSREAPPPQVPIERPSFVWPAMPPSFNGSDYSITGSQLTPFSDISAR